MTDTEQSLLTLLRRALFGCELPLPTDVDWQRVFEEAVSHSVHLLVYDCLTEQERAAIPKETAALWRQEVLSAMWYNEQLLGEQQAVLKALSGLPCVILKGSSSAACYPRPELRCAGDIDLLILPADLEKAEAILSARGYRPSENNHPFHRAMLREPFIVELHFERQRCAFAGILPNCCGRRDLSRRPSRPAAGTSGCFAVAPQAGAYHKQRTGAAAALRLGGVCPP